MPRDNLPQALRLAASGYKLVPLHTAVEGVCDCHRTPCPTPAKHPRITNWQKRGSSDSDDINRWWGQWPAANVGIACELSGMVVIDIDPRNGGDMTVQAWVEEHGAFHVGPKVITGGGGVHMYFKHPGGRVLSRSIAAGVDCKADGGQVVAPPSIHQTGMAYYFTEDGNPEVPLPDLPDWLLAMVSSRDQVISDGPKVLPDAIPQGQRRQWMLSFAGSMRQKGADQGMIFAALMSANETRCQPPLERGEIAGLAADAATRWEPGEAFIYSSTKRETVAQVAAYVPQPYTAVELMAREMPDVAMIVPGLLPEGLAILAGKPKLGKSFLAFCIGIAIAAGGIVMGQIPVEDGEALVLSLEDNERRLKTRLRGLLNGDVPSPRLFLETRWPREDAGGLNALDSWLGQHPAAVYVVIDTLAKFRPKGVESKYASDYAAIEGLQELAGQHSIVILLITHYRKAFSDDWLDNVTGTLGIAGAADTVLGLERPRGTAGQASAILHVTGRDVDEKDYALKMDGQTGQWTILGDADEYQMGLETAKLIAVLKEHGAPMKINEIAQRLGKKRTATGNLCSRAAGAGHIKSYGGGLYGVRVE